MRQRKPFLMLCHLRTFHKTCGTKKTDTRIRRKQQMLTAPWGLPKRSPTLVLIGPCATYLRSSEEIRCIGRGMAVSEGIYLPHHPNFPHNLVPSWHHLLLASNTSPLPARHGQRAATNTCPWYPGEQLTHMQKPAESSPSISSLPRAHKIRLFAGLTPPQKHVCFYVRFFSKKRAFWCRLLVFLVGNERPPNLSTLPEGDNGHRRCVWRQRQEGQTRQG